MGVSGGCVCCACLVGVSDGCVWWACLVGVSGRFFWVIFPSLFIFILLGHNRHLLEGGH